jgi:hypothetical protein
MEDSDYDEEFMRARRRQGSLGGGGGGEGVGWAASMLHLSWT